MRVRAFLFLMAVALLPSCATQALNPESVKDDVAAATAAWADAFNSRQTARIAALYDPEAVLWGTSSKKMATTPAEIAEYFNNASKVPSLKVAISDQKVRTYGDIAISTGAYTFSFPKGELAARFTFVFYNREGKWLIVEHHSSRVP